MNLKKVVANSRCPCAVSWVGLWNRDLPLFERRQFFRLLLGFSLAFGYSTYGWSAILAQENFDSISGFPSGGDPKLFGVPTTNGANDGNSKTIGNAGNDWYGARFELPQNGQIYQDVGVQKFGGAGNNSPVGLIEDDAGLMLRVDTTGYKDIVIDFDWRTFSATSRDKFVFGYYTGSLSSEAPASAYDPKARTFDLRNSVHGGQNGIWNWNPQNQGNTGNWMELLRGNARNTFKHESFNLDSGVDNSEVWLAFWLDNGEHDFGKFDNLVVTGTPVPLPAGLMLMFSGLMGLFFSKVPYTTKTTAAI